METKKEYKLRSLMSKFIDFMENQTDNYNSFCDCGLKNGTHMEHCRTTYFRKDVMNFQLELNAIHKEESN